jgi:hypothetical protein
MFAPAIALTVIASKMPADNPSKHVLGALSYRIGATTAAAALAIPMAGWNRCPAWFSTKPMRRPKKTIASDKSKMMEVMIDTFVLAAKARHSLPIYLNASLRRNVRSRRDCRDRPSTGFIQM